MKALSKMSPTLAEYTPLDCGVLRIGGRFVVFIDGQVHDQSTYLTRVLALDALRIHAMAPSRRQVEAQQSEI